MGAYNGYPEMQRMKLGGAGMPGQWYHAHTDAAKDATDQDLPGWMRHYKK